MEWTCAVVLAALAVLRTLVSFTPDRHFDVDPLAGEIAFPGFGPSGTMMLDICALVAGAALLLSRSARGAGVHRTWIALAALPLVALIWHGAQDAMDLALGCTWAAAIFTMVALAHAAHDPLKRRVLRAVLLAALVPIAARGVLQVEVPAAGYRGAEFAEQIASFEATRDEFFAGKGWDPQSSSARIFERRLRQAQPAGWFPSTNIFGSLMAAAMTIALFRAVLPGPVRVRVVAAVLSACALLLLVPTGSKGAWAAAAGGAGLAAIVAILHAVRAPEGVRRALRVAALAAVPGVLLAIIVRRWVLPESFAGELSLLFRGHYMEAATQMVRRAPLVGVGPDGFGRMYPLVRPPRNPEEVISAHGFFVDAVAAMGIFGLGWCALVMVMLAVAVRAFGTREAAGDGSAGFLDRSEMGSAASDQVIAHAALAAACAVLVAGAIAIRTEAMALTASMAALRLCALGAAAMFAHRLVTGGFGGRGEHNVTNEARASVAWRAAFAGGAVVLMVHAQMEMTAVLAGSAAWTFAILGVAAGAMINERGAGAGSHGDVKTSADAAATARRTAMLSRAACAAAVGVGLAALVIFGAAPLWKQESRVADVAAQLRASIPFIAAREGNARAAEEFRLRTQAAGALADAWRHAPGRVRPVRAAARMLERAAGLPGLPPAQRTAALQQSEELLSEAIAVFPRTELYAQRRTTREWQYALLRDRAALDRAIEDAQAVVQRDPNGLDAARVLARLLHEADRTQELQVVSRRVLEIDAAFELDPLKQLTDDQRAEVRAWATAE